MLQGLPWYVSPVFIGTTLLTLVFFYLASRKSISALFVMTGWMIVQATLSLLGFYQVTDTMPPRLILMIGPPLLFIAGLFATAKGRRFLDELDLRTLTLLHVIRIPVEGVLYWLALHQSVPDLLTFEGHNFDILSGLSAPIIFYFGFVRYKLNSTALLIWNILCLVLLINVVLHGILSAPTVFQQIAFDQPNRAMLYFPFTWLPSFIVPLVFLSHLATIRYVLKLRKKI